MACLDWLTAQPVAHRGLHDVAAGVIENTPSAVSAAISAGYAIEVDLQITADGEAMVHHDGALGRLTHGEGRLDRMNAADLKQVPFKATSDHMMTIGDLLHLVGGRVPLLLELKSRSDGDRRLVKRVAQALRRYAGPIAAMSFDLDQVEALREIAPELTRGVVAERFHPPAQGDKPSRRDPLAYLLHGLRSRPQFMAYHVKDLPAALPLLARHAFGMPLLTWTVRTEEDRQRAERWADQMIFEGFRP
jgi:glycerophosphoryl diester phosphodiesterase